MMGVWSVTKGTVLSIVHIAVIQRISALVSTAHLTPLYVIVESGSDIGGQVAQLLLVNVRKLN
jgi:hypothetical protein